LSKSSYRRHKETSEKSEMSEAAIVLPTGVAPYNRCHIHPMVVFNILDHHIRRPEADRVIGALLGTISEETGVVEIRNCFPVPHSEGEQVRSKCDFHSLDINLSFSTSIFGNQHFGNPQASKTNLGLLSSVSICPRAPNAPLDPIDIDYQRHFVHFIFPN
jgi:hypothetical protein